MSFQKIKLETIVIYFCVNLALCNQIKISNLYNQSSEHINKLTSCIGDCFLGIKNKTLNKCEENCLKRTETYDDINYLSSENEDYDVSLLCINDTHLIAKFTEPEISNHKQNLYVGTVKHLEVIVQTVISANELLIFDNLKPATSYEIHFSITTNAASTLIIKNVIQVETLKPNFDPQKVSNLRISSLSTPHIRLQSIDTVLSWTTAEVYQTCLYDIIILAHDASLETILENVPAAQYNFRYRIEGLQYGSLYHIGVQGVNYKTRKVSDIVWTEIETPSCQDLNKHNLSYCPIAPRGLHAELRTTDDELYTFNITWDSLETVPDYYEVRILDLFETNDSIPNLVSRTVSGHNTYLTLENILLRGTEYQIILVSKKGNNEEYDIITGSLKNHFKSKNEHRSEFSAVLVIVVGSAVFMILLGMLLIILHYKSKVTKTLQNKHKGLSALLFETVSPLRKVYADAKFIKDEKFEIERKNITLHEKLGEGAFGIVHRGIYLCERNNCELEVAVKILKDCSSADSRREFLREIEVMKSVGSHPNIVSIIGHCIENVEDMWLLTEFCKYGNLLHFLRSHRNLIKYGSIDYSTPTEDSRKPSGDAFNLDTSRLEKYLGENKRLQYNQHGWQSSLEKCSCGYLSMNGVHCICKFYVENPDYFQYLSCAVLENDKSSIKTDLVFLTDSYKNRMKPINSSELVEMARQIATGMEFLAKNKVVHRDLAARNILMSENRQVKIADFGLSRDVYHDNIYRKTSDSKLPLKWLALESLTHQVYTSQSDVWSYGILLYEICTFGGIPYPGVEAEQLMRKLIDGYRMEKPKSCSHELYTMMKNCWMENPVDRPNFSQICQNLEEITKNRDKNVIYIGVS